MTEQIPLVVSLALLLATSGACVALLVRTRRLRQRYGGIADIDDAVSKARGELDRLTAEREQTIAARTTELESLDAEYRNAKRVYDDLKREVSLVEENLEDISFGVYKPHYDFQTSDEYKTALADVRERQKAMIRAGKAGGFKLEWTVGGSRSEGVKMQKQYVKLILRAFNGESDAAIANVTWNNVVRMQERISKCFDAINKLGGVMTVAVDSDYRDLKLAELRLKHELEEKRRAEREEERQRRERMRDEERAQRELERAREDAEEDEARYERALEAARSEVAGTQGAALDRLSERIKELEERVRLAHEQKERAVSRAQLTRSGHVYIISNIGSFGERVVKIGMTRRLEPRERIKELSDASVPFEFDVHAILYSEDAPSLEASFHQAFGEKRINLVNGRKEFFAVTIDEVEEFVRSRTLNCVLNKLCEARDYRQTLALRNGQAEKLAGMPTGPGTFPDELIRRAARMEQ